MPRGPRQLSSSGIYHIMLRGINQQVIFEDDEDYLKFVEIIVKYKEICKYKVFAFCLMSNHIHLLLKIDEDCLATAMKRIAGSYAFWYNRKYYRMGHLFQDRFKSEPVEDDSYFLTVVRYIHQNPIKAGMINELYEYKYSSYFDYYCGESEVVDMDFVYTLLSKDEFIEFNNEENNDLCLDISDRDFILNDIDAKEIIKQISKCNNSSEFKALSKEQQNRYIKKFKELGLSIRQMSRLTGISKGVIERILIK